MGSFKATYTPLQRHLYFRSGQRLYLAKDHLLLVEGGNLTEYSYKIALDDVQAVTTTKSPAWHFYTLMLMLPLTAVFLLPFDASTELTFAAVLAAPFTIGLAINLLLGPTCKTVLRTAVKQHPLTSLGRVRTAKKTIPRIAQAIRERQGNFEPPQPETAPPDYPQV